MPPEEATEGYWFRVIGLCLAYLVLHLAEMKDEDMLTKAKFLERFGLSRRDIAQILQTSEDSLRVLAGRAQRRGRGSRGEKGARQKPRREG